MQGKRLPDFQTPINPGEYSKRPFKKENWFWPGNPYWEIKDPQGKSGLLITHKVIEHEDETITVSPSILSPGGWHGFLEKGIWREC